MWRNLLLIWHIIQNDWKTETASVPNVFTKTMFSVYRPGHVSELFIDHYLCSLGVETKTFCAAKAVLQKKKLWKLTLIQVCLQYEDGEGPLPLCLWSLGFSGHHWSPQQIPRHRTLSSSFSKSHGCASHHPGRRLWPQTSPASGPPLRSPL